jgi:hypothetical protein
VCLQSGTGNWQASQNAQTTGQAAGGLGFSWPTSPARWPIWPETIPSSLSAREIVHTQPAAPAGSSAVAIDLCLEWALVRCCSLYKRLAVLVGADSWLVVSILGTDHGSRFSSPSNTGTTLSPCTATIRLRRARRFFLEGLRYRTIFLALAGRGFRLRPG